MLRTNAKIYCIRMTSRFRSKPQVRRRCEFPTGSSHAGNSHNLSHSKIIHINCVWEVRSVVSRNFISPSVALCFAVTLHSSLMPTYAAVRLVFKTQVVATPSR